MIGQFRIENTVFICTGCSVDVYSVKTNRSKQSRKLCDGCAGTASMGDSCCLVLTLCADEIITIDSESDFNISK